MDITPPKADKIAKNLEIHDDVRVDDYYWLNEKENMFGVRMIITRRSQNIPKN